MNRPAAAPPRCRLATRADVPELVALEEASFPACDRFPRATWVRLTQSASALIVVARMPALPAIPAAVAWLLRSTSHTARMYSLAVHPDARGRGLAQTLFAASLRRLPERINRLSLEVRVDNAPARALYERLGFVVSQHLAGYYDDGGDGVRMTRSRRLVVQPAG